MINPMRIAVRLVSVVAALGLGATGTARATVDLTGQWIVVQQVPFVPDSCPTTIVQTGTAIQLDAFCVFGVDFAATGTIDPMTGSFTATGTCGFSGPTGWTLTMTGASPDGLTMSGTITCPGALPGPTAFTGTRQVVCGNGIVEPGEECDPGIDPCCDDTCLLRTDGPCTTVVEGCIEGTCDASSTCTPIGPSPAGAACEVDGDRCTQDRCDGAGTCVVEGPLECGMCSRCAAGACIPDRWPNGSDAGECQAVMSAIDASIVRVDQRRQRVTWRLFDGPIRAPAVVGAPTAGTDYAVCLFGEILPGPSSLSLLGEGSAPAGAEWRPRPGGFAYRFARNPHGLVSLRLHKRDSGDTFVPERLDARATLRGAAAVPTADFVALGFDQPGARLDVQLRSSDGACWHVPFFALEVRKPWRLVARY